MSCPFIFQCSSAAAAAAAAPRWKEGCKYSQALLLVRFRCVACPAGQSLSTSATRAACPACLSACSCVCVARARLRACVWRVRAGDYRSKSACYSWAGATALLSLPRPLPLYLWTKGCTETNDLAPVSQRRRTTDEKGKRSAMVTAKG